MIICSFLIIASSIVNNTFENTLLSLKEIYKLMTKPQTNRVRLAWKHDYRKKPVCRDTEPTVQGIRIATDGPLQYIKGRNYLQRLGRSCKRKAPLSITCAVAIRLYSLNLKDPS